MALTGTATASGADDAVAVIGCAGTSGVSVGCADADTDAVDSEGTVGVTVDV